MNLNRPPGRVGAKSTYLGQIRLTHVVFEIQTTKIIYIFPGHQVVGRVKKVGNYALK